MSTIILPTSFTPFVKPRQQATHTVQTLSEACEFKVVLPTDHGLTDSEQFLAIVRELADLNENDKLPEGYKAWYMMFPSSGTKKAGFVFPDGTRCRIECDRSTGIRIVERDQQGFERTVCDLSLNDPLNKSLQEILFPN